MHDEKKCSKKYPKSYTNRTSFDANGYPVYRWRDTGLTIEKNGHIFDNRYYTSIIFKALDFIYYSVYCYIYVNLLY